MKNISYLSGIFSVCGGEVNSSKYLDRRVFVMSP